MKIMKKLTKKEIISYLIYIAMIIAGSVVEGFTGGLITGCGLMLLVFVTVGKWQLKKAAVRMDKLNEAVRKIKNSTDENY